MRLREDLLCVFDCAGELIGTVYVWYVMPQVVPLLLQQTKTLTETYEARIKALEEKQGVR